MSEVFVMYKPDGRIVKITDSDFSRLGKNWVQVARPKGYPDKEEAAKAEEPVQLEPEDKDKEMRDYLRERGVKHAHLLGKQKLKELYEAETQKDGASS